MKRCILPILAAALIALTAWAWAAYEPRQAEPDEPMPEVVEAVEVEQEEIIVHEFDEDARYIDRESLWTEARYYVPMPSSTTEPQPAVMEQVVPVVPTNTVSTEPIDQIDEPNDEVDGMTYLGSWKITGYDICPSCCGNSSGICASGAIATVGTTCAVNGYPFGTVLYIEGIGYRVVQDRGGMGANHVDVLCNNHDECYAITGYREVWLVG